MDKVSKQPFVKGFSLKGNLRHAKRFVKALDPRIKGAVIGGGAYGTLGAVGAHSHNKRVKQKKTRPGESKKKIHPALLGGALGATGALSGAYIGQQVHNIRQDAKFWRNLKRRTSWGSWRSGSGRPGSGGGYAPPPHRERQVSTPAWMGNVKTKTDAKKAWRAQAQKHHPDRGGNAETMKKINAEWDAFENSDNFKKLAGVLPSFLDELMEIFT